MTSGSDTITSGVRNPRNRTLNVSPKRRRQDSRKEIGRTSQRIVCTTGGSLGPAGRALGGGEWTAVIGLLDGTPAATGLRPDHGAGRDAICTTAGVSVP
jgi:hypothetical protein